MMQHPLTGDRKTICSLGWQIHNGTYLTLTLTLTIALILLNLMVTVIILTLLTIPRQIFRIGTVRYAEGLWRMRSQGPVIAHCTDSEDFPIPTLLTLPQSTVLCIHTYIHIYSVNITCLATYAYQKTHTWNSTTIIHY